jgi:hypothetical protein
LVVEFAMSDFARSIDIGHLLAVLSWAIYPLIAYSYAGGILPFLIALRTIRIRRTGLDDHRPTTPFLRAGSPGTP